MTAQYGRARTVYGKKPGTPLFVIVTDGKEVRFLNTPASTDSPVDYENMDDQTAKVFSYRSDHLLEEHPDNADPTLMLERLGYNLPFSISVSDIFPTMNDAYAAAQTEIAVMGEEQTA